MHLIKKWLFRMHVIYILGEEKVKVCGLFQQVLLLLLIHQMIKVFLNLQMIKFIVIQLFMNYLMGLKTCKYG